jgi:sortase (surface protein transpeptidase)
MTRHRAPSRATAWRLLAATALVAGAVALLLSPGPGPGPAAADVPAAASTPLAVVAETPAPAVAVEPVRVRVPAIGVDSPLVRRGTDAAGALVPPAEFDRAGWFTGGAAPGDVGPAVLAGHVDSANGPAVFWRLRDLAPGDDVLVDRGDGTTVAFTVTAVARYPKDEFPTAAVYGPTPRAELRLITCGGTFDRALRSYTDNVVVSAVLAG